MITAIKMIDNHVRDLRDFFKMFDVYDGRIFWFWELDEIFQHKVALAQMQQLNKSYFELGKEGAMADALHYKYICEIIMNCPTCPLKFKDDKQVVQNYSIY